VKNTSLFLSIVGALFGLAYAYDRWIGSWHQNRKVNQLIRDARGGKRSQPEPSKPIDHHFGITFDPTEVVMAPLKKASEEAVSIPWNKISRILVFKRDLFTVDCICLLIATEDGPAYELNEEMKGWRSFIEALPEHIPGCKPWTDWFQSVAFPAFATNETEIYLKKAGSKT